MLEQLSVHKEVLEEEGAQKQKVNLIFLQVRKSIQQEDNIHYLVHKWHPAAYLGQLIQTDLFLGNP